jgi:hypothetical protein
MLIVIGLLGAGLAFALVRLFWLDRQFQKLAATVIEQGALVNKLTDLMVQSGEILLTVVKRDNNG